MSQSKCLAVMYHYVRDRNCGPEDGIQGLTSAEFEAQIDALSADLTPIDWTTFVGWRNGETIIPDASLLLTFDDGLSDHAEVVAPILESHSLHGIFFVSTAVLVHQRMDTAHQIHLLISRLGDRALSISVDEWLSANEPAVRLETSADSTEAQRVYHYESPQRAELKYLLTRLLPTEIRRKLIDELFEYYVGDNREYASRWYMQWDQLADLQGAGHTIGGHSHNHLPYTLLTTAEQSDDMSRCASAITKRLGRRHRPFSYPYGDHDASAANCCNRAGFVNGFTTREDWIGRTQDGHSLARVDTIHVDLFLERELSCREA